jgi:hypothetical protein
LNFGSQRPATFTIPYDFGVDDRGKNVGRPESGIANVALDPTFASAIDRNAYLVMVTLEGDCRGCMRRSEPRRVSRS